MKKRLNLRAETLRTLSRIELSGANGGMINASPVWCQTMRTCFTDCDCNTQTCTTGFD